MHNITDRRSMQVLLAACAVALAITTLLLFLLHARAQAHHSPEIASKVTSRAAEALRSDSSIGIYSSDVYSVEAYLPLIARNYPPAPRLNPIPRAAADNSYEVSWELDYDEVERYTLQESTSADFGDITGEFTTSLETHYHVEKGVSARGTLYYRVRADGKWGEGPWSNVQSVAIQFSDPNSGWVTHQANCCFPPYYCDDVYGGRENLDYKYSLYYDGERYHTYIPTSCYEGGTHGFTRFIYPVSLAPDIERSTNETCIELRGSFEKPQHVASWGLVFASSKDMSTHYALWVNERGEWGVIKRTGYQFPGPNHGQYNEERTDIVGPLWGANPGTAPNRLRVRIKDNNVTFYLNGVEKGYLSASDISSLQYVGIIGGNWEEGDVRIGYDYFYLDEGCDDF